MLRKLALLFSFCFMGLVMYAQQPDTATEEAVDFMNSNGKIYVVMAVALVIVVGLFIYLISLDRKIKKLEKGEAR